MYTRVVLILLVLGLFQMQRTTKKERRDIKVLDKYLKANNEPGFRQKIKSWYLEVDVKKRNMAIVFWSVSAIIMVPVFFIIPYVKAPLSLILAITFLIWIDVLLWWRGKWQQKNALIMVQHAEGVYLEMTELYLTLSKKLRVSFKLVLVILHFWLLVLGMGFV